MTLHGNSIKNGSEKVVTQLNDPISILGTLIGVYPSSIITCLGVFQLFLRYPFDLFGQFSNSLNRVYKSLKISMILSPLGSLGGICGGGFVVS